MVLLSCDRARALLLLLSLTLLLFIILTIGPHRSQLRKAAVWASRPPRQGKATSSRLAPTLRTSRSTVSRMDSSRVFRGCGSGDDP